MSVTEAVDTEWGRENLLEKFGVLWILEVLEVAEVGDKVWLVEDLLLGQVIEIGGIGEALHELGEVSDGSLE